MKGLSARIQRGIKPELISCGEILQLVKANRLKSFQQAYGDRCSNKKGQEK
jgi:hypothetical protein